MMSAMTRRFLARAAGPLALLGLLAAFLGGATLLADDPEAADPGPAAASAAEAFEAAYAVFEEDFAAGSALAAKDATLAERTASVRAVRLAFSDFDTTVATIVMPDPASDVVTAMRAAVEDLIVKFDLQGATTTVAAYRDANPAAAAAYTAARDAIQKVRAALSGLSRPADEVPGAVDLPAPGSQQTPVTGPYLRENRVSGVVAWRDALLAIAATNGDPRYVQSPSLGIREGWVAAFPELLTDAAVVAAGAEAPRSGISGFVVMLPDPGAEPSRTNVPYLAFATRDNKGGCAGGVVSGFPALTTTTPVNLPRSQVCTGLAVAAAAGFEEE